MTKQWSLSSTPVLERQTSSGVSRQWPVLFGQPHRKLHTWVELLLRGASGLLEGSSQRSQLLASSPTRQETVCLGRLSRQDSESVADTWESKLHDTLFYILNVRRIGVPFSDCTVSAPGHSSTGTARRFLLNS